MYKLKKKKNLTTTVIYDYNICLTEEKNASELNTPGLLRKIHVFQPIQIRKK